MGSASPLVAFVFVLCFHFPVYSCNKRTIVLRGPKIYRDGHCSGGYGCRSDQVKTSSESLFCNLSNHRGTQEQEGRSQTLLQ